MGEGWHRTAPDLSCAGFAPAINCATNTTKLSQLKAYCLCKQHKLLILVCFPVKDKHIFTLLTFQSLSVKISPFIYYIVVLFSIQNNSFFNRNFYFSAWSKSNSLVTIESYRSSSSPVIDNNCFQSS